MRPRAEGQATLAAGMQTGLMAGPEVAAVDGALDQWRHKAADLLLVAAALTHLPVVILLMLGQGAPMAWWLRDAFIPLYVVMAVAALFRGVNYRTRLLVFFAVAYAAVAIASVVNPHGPYSQVGLVTIPSLVLILLGNRLATAAITASAALVPSAAFLRARPGLMQLLGVGDSYAPSAEARIAVLVVWLMGLMLLLGRFERFLTNSLAAQFRTNAALERAKTELESEVAERTAAQSKVEREMRERQRLEGEMASLSDEERRRLGRELHDGVCQQVTAALLNCQVLGRRLKSGGALTESDFQGLSSLLSETIADARDIARGLCPLDSDPDALTSALRSLARQTQDMAAVPCEFSALGDVRVPDPLMAQHLYRIAQEALSNAVRHAHAGRIRIELDGSAEELLLRVKDDGAGLPAELPSYGLGMRTMAYRAETMRGELTISQAEGGGTCVTCRVPRSAGPQASWGRSGEQRWIPTA